MFPPEEVVSYINETILKDSGDFSIDDIRKKNVQSLVKVYFSFLVSLGYSRDMFLNQFNTLFESPEPEVDEILRDEDMKIKLCSLLSWLFKRIDHGDRLFSYDDVTNPDMERTMYFLGVLKNFCLFLDQRKQTDSQIEDEVLMLRARKEQLLNEQQINLDPEKEKVEYQKMYEHGVQELEALELNEEKMLQEVNAYEAEAKEAEEIYLQEVESKREAEKIIKTVQQITDLRGQAAQLQTQMKALDDDVINLKKLLFSWEQYEPMLKVDTNLTPEEDRNLKSVIEEHRVEERNLAREEKQLDKNNIDCEMDIETINNNMSNNMSKFNMKKEKMAKDLESLGRDISRISGSDENCEVQECITIKNKLTDQMNNIDMEIMEIERQNEDFTERIRLSLDRFAVNSQSDLNKIKEAAHTLPRGN